ncbi:hypothetical protein CRG98_049416, partial [Punica granatum]
GCAGIMWPRGKESPKASGTPRNLTAPIAKGMAVGFLAWPNPPKALLPRSRIIPSV